MDSPRFDLASEAFATFRELLLRFLIPCKTAKFYLYYYHTVLINHINQISLKYLLHFRHKVLSNEFLQKNFDNFFYMFNKKLVSENFVTKK